jgi:hypothetical protein
MTAAGMWGADVMALEQLGRDLDGAAERLASIQNRLRVRIHASPWGGPDAERFGTDWDGVHRATLAAAETALRTAGETVRRNASEQLATSVAEGRVGSGAPGAPGGGDPVRDVIQRLSACTEVVDTVVTFGVLSQFSPRWPAGTPGGMGGQFRALGDMSLWERLKAGGNKENWVAKPNLGGARGSWEAVGKWAGRAGVVLSFAEGAYGQWTSDADDPTLSTTTKVARATVIGGTTAVGGWAGATGGAWAGAGFGLVLGGPAGAAVGGAVGGFVGGVAGSEVGKEVGHLAVDGATKLGEALAPGLESAGSWLSHHNPFG